MRREMSLGGARENSHRGKTVQMRRLRVYVRRQNRFGGTRENPQRRKKETNVLRAIFASPSLDINVVWCDTRELTPEKDLLIATFANIGAGRRVIWLNT